MPPANKPHIGHCLPSDLEYIARARTLDHAHRQADGTPHPRQACVIRCVITYDLVGPVLAALQSWDPVIGLVVGSYQGCS